MPSIRGFCSGWKFGSSGSALWDLTNAADGLRDDQWERIKNLLPGRVGVTAADNRLFVEAVLYRYRTGLSWSDLPERFSDWKNVHHRHSRWSAVGVWEQVFRHLAADADNEYAMIDSTVMRGPVART